MDISERGQTNSDWSRNQSEGKVGGIDSQRGIRLQHVIPVIKLGSRPSSDRLH